MFSLPLATALLLLGVIGGADAQYCQCLGPRLFNDPLQLCLTSGDYGVQNSCFICPVKNGTGSYFYCDSNYARGFGTCAQPGSLAARQAACLAIGGDPSSPDFRCLDNAGANQSQVLACSGVTAAPTAPVTATGAPTSDATTGSPLSWLLCGLVLLFLIVC